MLKIVFKLYALLISLNTLKILKALRIVAEPPNVKFVYLVKKILPKDPMTIIRSKTFHPSLK